MKFPAKFSGDAQKSQKTKVGFVGCPKIHLIAQEDLVWVEFLGFGRWLGMWDFLLDFKGFVGWGW